ncbi:transposase [Methanonatronarchaeum sp. AMET-Sl]|nr:transposase [Methanonatronarchaeum sp. AMET-Sl]WGI17472.1 transposase [Methanonatronarchaeum sp. AMET-Sl]
MDIESGNEGVLYDGTLEARKAYNETIQLAKQGEDWDDIDDIVAEKFDLVKNTAQRIVAKALGAMENYYEYDDFGKPSHTKDGSYPLRSNYEEGYNLSLADDGCVKFRVSAKPYKHVKGTLNGSDQHLNLLRTALQSDEWSIGTSEVIYHDEKPELHVNITNEELTIRDQQDSKTLIGLDVNEDNVALSALTEEGVQDSIVIEFPEIKFERHRYFTIRKRVQNAEKNSVFHALGDKEKRFVNDKTHKLSRQVIEWCQQFEHPCIVLEDLKEMRENIDYGTRMNRRLHHLPFNLIQSFVSYKAAFEGIPVAWINPEYTSQRCSMCGYAEKANRKRKRFKCLECSHQDHSDRNAGVNIAVKGVAEAEVDWNVPTLYTLPVIRTGELRQSASGCVNQPSVTHSTVRDNTVDGGTGSISS